MRGHSETRVFRVNGRRAIAHRGESRASNPATLYSAAAWNGPRSPSGTAASVSARLCEILSQPGRTSRCVRAAARPCRFARLSFELDGVQVRWPGYRKCSVMKTTGIRFVASDRVTKLSHGFPRPCRGSRARANWCRSGRRSPCPARRGSSRDTPIEGIEWQSTTTTVSECLMRLVDQPPQRAVIGLVERLDPRQRRRRPQAASR